MSSRFHWVAAIKSKKDEEEIFGRSLVRGRETTRTTIFDMKRRWRKGDLGTPMNPRFRGVY